MPGAPVPRTDGWLIQFHPPPCQCTRALPGRTRAWPDRRPGTSSPASGWRSTRSSCTSGSARPPCAYPPCPVRLISHNLQSARRLPCRLPGCTPWLLAPSPCGQLPAGGRSCGHPPSPARKSAHRSAHKSTHKSAQKTAHKMEHDLCLMDTGLTQDTVLGTSGSPWRPLPCQENR